MIWTRYARLAVLCGWLYVKLTLLIHVRVTPLLLDLLKPKPSLPLTRLGSDWQWRILNSDDVEVWAQCPSELTELASDNIGLVFMRCQKTKGHAGPHIDCESHTWTARP